VLSGEVKDKIIDILIEVLHCEHFGNRDLAVVQLVLLGNKSVNPLLTFLEKEEKLHFNLQSKPIQYGAHSHYPLHTPAWRDFKEKWGHFPNEYTTESFANSRKNSIIGALRVLELLGVENVINGFPILSVWLAGTTDFNINSYTQYDFSTIEMVLKV